MATSSSSMMALFPIVVILLFPLILSCKLTTDHYCDSCPNVLDIIKPIVKDAIRQEPRNAASLIRLHFHDCFVNGCDGSVLLDDMPSLQGEKTAPPNNNSLRAFDVVDAIKEALERECPGVVSCSDILAISSRDSVEILGGPTWTLKLGRKDSRTPFFNLSIANLPPPSLNVSGLTEAFQKVGLNEKDVVVLSGAHTLGLARCVTFRDHVYNSTTLESAFASSRQSICPRPDGTGDSNLAPLDVRSPVVFDNQYYKNLVAKRGLLNSDQVLADDGSTSSLVNEYSVNQNKFFEDFIVSMIRMGDIQPEKGTPLEVRTNCRRIN